MRYEILKVQNGYMVIPCDYYKNGNCIDYNQVWVFTSYQALCDKLAEILALESK
jgi:hypothetical protein